MTEKTRMLKIIFEVNTDFKGKITRQRKVFMESVLKMLSGNEETHNEGKKKLMEYGVKIIGERDAGDDLVVKINGDLIHKG